MAVSNANRSRTICPVCSLQDGLILQWRRPSPRYTEESQITVDYDLENRINEGSLCPRGNSVAELVDHPQRLIAPRADGKEIDWKDALSRTAASLKKLAKKHGPEAIGILVGGGLTLEESLAVDKLGREILGTPNVAPLFPDDGVVFHRLAGLGWDVGFDLEELQDRQVMLLVGDVFMEHPVISKRVLRAKYKNRRHRLFVLDSVASQTAGFAHQHLQPRPGTEALVLAGIAQMLSEAEGGKSEGFSMKLDLKAVAQRTGISQEQMGTVASALSTASDGAIVQSNLYGRLGSAGACAFLGHALTRLAAGKFTFLHLPVFWNGQGVYRMLSSAEEGSKGITGPRILELVMEGNIKGLLLFGVDPLSATPSQKLEAALKKLELLCVADALPTHSTALAHVLLPAAVGPEKGGRVLYLNGDLQEFQPAVPAPGAAKPEGEIVEQLAHQLSPKEEFSVSPQEVQERLKGNGGTSWTEMLAELEPGIAKLLSSEETEETAYPIYLVPASVSAHLGDGSLTRHFGWAQRVCRGPIVWASPSLMEKLKLKSGDQVQISSRIDQAIFPLALDGSLPENVISAPAHFPDVRRLFPWNLDPDSKELELGPERVLLSKSKERS